MTTGPQEESNASEKPGEELRSSDFDHLPPEERAAAMAEALEEAQREAAQNLDGALRAQAELANFRRRADEERISNAKYSNSRLITKILPVMAEFELAIEHARHARHASQTGPNDSWLEGVKLIHRKLAGVLESEGVTAIETDGVMFNPSEHEAVGTEISTGQPPGSITQTMRPGFRLHDRVIQPAQVMVAQAPPDAGQERPAEGTGTADTPDE